MKDQMALAYVNLYAVLGTLPELCRTNSEAYSIIEATDISVGFSVKDGPSATILFANGECLMKKGLVSPKITLSFSTPEKFNGMIDGTVTPIPTSGIIHAGFLIKKFKKLTDILESCLRPLPEKLKDEEFFNKSTELMMGVIARAVCALGNHDGISRVSASYITDGDIRLGIKDGYSLIIRAKGGILNVIRRSNEKITSYMEFKDIRTARDLFDGRINSVAAVGMGDVTIGGMVSQIDNINRILNRVSEYLA